MQVVSFMPTILFFMSSKATTTIDTNQTGSVSTTLVCIPILICSSLIVRGVVSSIGATIVLRFLLFHDLLFLLPFA